MNFIELFQHIVNGLTLGGMFALVALGYTMVYGILELVNFAHGDIFMVGSFLGLFTINYLLGNGITSWYIVIPTAFVVSMLLTPILGIVLERVAYRPLRKAPKITVLVAAIGSSIFISNFMMLTAGRNLKPFPQLPSFSGMENPTINISGIHIQYIQIVIVLTSIALMIILDIFVNKTKLGQGMRATSQDPETAQMMGVSINKIIVLTFVLGSALAAAGGVMNGLYYGGIKFNDGFVIGIKAFTAAVLGGIGNIRGAMLGGFVLGLCETVIIAIFDLAGLPEAFDYKDAIAFLILVLILTLRPSGILGSSAPEKV